jgi:hypothetical protein
MSVDGGKGDVAPGRVEVLVWHKADKLLSPGDVCS